MPATKKPSSSTSKTKAAAKKSAARTAAKSKPTARTSRPSRGAKTASASEAETKTSNMEDFSADAEQAFDADPGARAEDNDNPFASATDPGHLQAMAIRLVAFLFYGIVGYFVLIGLFFIAAAQFVLALATGSPNDDLRNFAGRLSAYLGDILDYLAFRRGSDEYPFPFQGATFPEARNRDNS